MTNGLLEFLKMHKEEERQERQGVPTIRRSSASTFSPSADLVTIVQRLFDGWKFVVLDDSGLVGDQVRFWMFNQVLYWDPALALVLNTYNLQSPWLMPLHTHMAHAFGYRPAVPQCVLIAHLSTHLSNGTMTSIQSRTHLRDTIHTSIGSTGSISSCGLLRTKM